MIPIWFGIFMVFSLGVLFSCYHLVLPAMALLLLPLGIAWGKSALSGRAVAAALIFVLAWFYTDLLVPPNPAGLPTLRQAEISGRIDSYPSFDGRNTSFVLKTDHRGQYRKKIQVFCFFETSLRKGDRVVLRGDLKPPAPPGNPGELDYPFYLRGQSIYYTLSIKEAGAVKVTGHAGGLTAWLVNYQEEVRNRFKAALAEDDANILLGMLLGVVEGIDPEEYRDYQKTGIIHVFSVSGMHIAFLLLVAAWVTSLLDLRRGVRLAVGIGLLLLYGGLTGWPPPVLRSAIMGGLGLLAFYSGRENSMLNSLGLAGLIILMLNPAALLQMSFQFTFLATWGLVGLFPLVKRRLNYQSRFWDLLLIPLCAQLPMLPLLIYHFNLFSPVSLLSNILLGYLSGVVVVLGFLALLFAGWLPGLAGLFLNPAGGFIEIIRTINTYLVSLPGAYFWVAAPPLITIILYYLGLLLALYALARQRSRRWLLGGGLLMGVLLVTVFLPAGLYDRGRLQEVFIDVGQGDSILIKTAQGKFILVDGGGSEYSDIAHRKLMPYLHHRGINHVWLAVNTHPDTDHLQGLETVLSEVKVERMAIPASLTAAPQYDSLKKILQDEEIPLYQLAAGDCLNIEEGLIVKVLYPEGNSPLSDVNEQSLVLQLQFGNFSSLLTGDLRQAGLQSLTNAGLERMTVVKIPHHGSKGSLVPALYDQTSPRWAVISVGANNRFGHPSPAVLEELVRRNIKVFRTDSHGAVTIDSDGQTSSISSYRQVVHSN